VIWNYTELTAQLRLSLRKNTATKGQYTQAAPVTSILVYGKPPLRVQEKHEHCLIQLLIARVVKAKNNNHQEPLNHGLNNKNQQVMVAVSGNTGISNCYQQVYSAR
jgi:hypothetical protein